MAESPFGLRPFSMRVTRRHDHEKDAGFLAASALLRRTYQENPLSDFEVRAAESRRRDGCRTSGQEYAR
jgi:hypothetical protein